MSWFPIPEELLFDSEQFRRLPTTAKVFMLALMSEANLRHSEFYRSDYEWAVRLKASTSTVYRARRELLRLGWTGVIPGTNNDRGGGLATRYLWVMWSTPPQEGHWTQMPRYMFETILDRFGPTATLAYVYLTAEKHRYRRRFEDRGKFFISLGDMQRASGLRNLYQITRKLHHEFKFNGEKHLFEFSGYRRLVFTEWNVGDEEVNAEIYLQREEKIRLAARQLKIEEEGRMEGTRRTVASVGVHR